MTEIAFPAILKSVSVKRTASEDREARIILDFRPDEDVMNGLVSLMQLEQEVMVGIVAECSNTRKEHGIQKRHQRKPEGQEAGNAD